VGRAFDLADAWPVEHRSVGFIDRRGQIHLHGDRERVYRLASLSKLMTAWATLIAVEDGSITLDDLVDDRGCTVRHLLCHAGGYGFDNPTPIVSPGRKRIYSNTGYDMLAEYVAEFVDMDFAEFLDEAVFAPLGMTNSALDGSAAKDVHGTLEDVSRFAAELREPKLIARETYVMATTTQFPDLDGVVPGLGSFAPCPWGLGPEIHGTKHPHWMPERASASAFGHFGGSGTFLWMDPPTNIACFGLTDREFGDWAIDAWPTFGDVVLDEGLGV
jgi:CubicO group peptidase (beta-lactamase class C family)